MAFQSAILLASLHNIFDVAAAAALSSKRQEDKVISGLQKLLGDWQGLLCLPQKFPINSIFKNGAPTFQSQQLPLAPLHP